MSERFSQEQILSVVKGNPTDEEIAALVLVLAGSGGRSTAGSTGASSQWSAYWRNLHSPIAPGPASWRQSARL